MGFRDFGSRPKIRSHVPGQQFLNPAERMIGDAAEHFAQPAFRIDAVEACRSQQRVDGGRALAATVGSTEEIVFALMQIFA
jgi:hypothetical protein